MKVDFPCPTSNVYSNDLDKKTQRERKWKGINESDSHAHSRTATHSQLFLPLSITVGMPICAVVNVWTRAYHAISHWTEPNRSVNIMSGRGFFSNPNSLARTTYHNVSKNNEFRICNRDQSLIYSTLWIQFHIHDLGHQIRFKWIRPLCSIFNKIKERRDQFLSFFH